MTDCIFCKIINNEIPSYKIYEDKDTYAFLDISKDAFGHTLVVPKKHYENFYEIPEDELAKINQTIKKIISSYKEKGFNGVNIINNSGKAAGQTVFHIHFHLFPRKDNDGLNLYNETTHPELNLDEIKNSLKIN